MIYKIVSGIGMWKLRVNVPPLVTFLSDEQKGLCSKRLYVEFHVASMHELFIFDLHASLGRFYAMSWRMNKDIFMHKL